MNELSVIADTILNIPSRKPDPGHVFNDFLETMRIKTQELMGKKTSDLTVVNLDKIDEVVKMLNDLKARLVAVKA
jgi:hypothetical protein